MFGLALGVCEFCGVGGPPPAPGGFRSPKVASALDRDSRLKLRRPLRLFGSGGRPSIVGLGFLTLGFSTFLHSTTTFNDNLEK